MNILKMVASEILFVVGISSYSIWHQHVC